jgi:sugar phosphate isomerase/epimerase
MLLTLASRSLESLMTSSGEGDASMTILDVPEYTIRHLQLRGINVPASAFAGWSLTDLDRLRDRADKVGCPCLVLIEDTALPFGQADEARVDEATDRVSRLAAAAHRLGCNALAISCDASETDDAFELAASQIKAVMPAVERLELNLLLAPREGLTRDADRLTELIKRVGGFRIGSLPSFGHAASTGDVIGTLRKLAPYAGSVQATVDRFTKAGKHKGYDLAECIEAIRSVGFVNTVAIDYVGKTDPIDHIDKAREILTEAIEAE